MHYLSLDTVIYRPDGLRDIVLCQYDDVMAELVEVKPSVQLQREFVIGRNAKGTRPVKNTGLHPVTVRYAACGRPSERRLNLALDTTEAVVSVLRRTRGEVVFAFAPPGVLKAQWSLF